MVVVSIDVSDYNWLLEEHQPKAFSNYGRLVPSLLKVKVPKVRRHQAQLANHLAAVFHQKCGQKCAYTNYVSKPMARALKNKKKLWVVIEMCHSFVPWRQKPKKPMARAPLPSAPPPWHLRPTRSLWTLAQRPLLWHLPTVPLKTQDFFGVAFHPKKNI